MGELEVPLWGAHNISNVVAAAAAARRIGLSFAQIREGLLAFQGVRRRMETVGEAGGITVIDDFAHHPTAVRETLRALQSRFPGRRLWAVFEPRSQTMRRKVLQQGLVQALAEADRVVLGRPFSPPAPGEALDPERVVEEINRHKGDGAASYLEATDRIVALCVAEATPGDVIVVMSSGHFRGVAGADILGPGEARVIFLICKHGRLFYTPGYLTKEGLTWESFRGCVKG